MIPRAANKYVQEYLKVLSILQKTHQPTMLEMFSHSTHFQHVVMTLLSARSKDSTVIPIVKEFFSKYPEPQDIQRLPVQELEKWFFKIGFYKTKAKHVHELSNIILNKYHGHVPDTFEELVSLPVVGRKTANCVLAYSFGKPAIAVDIHVHRISNRLGWVHTQKPEETEEALKRIIDKKDWIDINRLLVDHGQRICLPIKPKCPECGVKRYCRFWKDNFS